MTIDDIKWAHESAGKAFFAVASRKFFRSRVLHTVFEGPGGIFFVTSDREPEHAFIVRAFNPATADVHTATERFGTVRSAFEAARQWSSGNGPRPTYEQPA